MNFFPADTRTLLWVGTGLYLAGFLYSLAYVVLGRSHVRPLFYTLVAGGFGFQTLGLYLRGLQTGLFPLGNTFETLQVIAWVTVLLKLILRTSFQLRLLGFFASLLATVLCAVSLSFPEWDTRATVTFSANPWVEFHVALAIFSYGVFGLLAVTSLMYSLQDYGLHQKRFAGIFALLPPLRELDAMNQRLLHVGFWVLTLAVALGLFNWIGDPRGVGALKLIVAAALWAWALGVVVLRSRGKLVGRRFAIACLVLFVVALFSLWPVDRARERRQHAFMPDHASR